MAENDYTQALADLNIPRDILPPELGGEFLTNLDKMLARQEGRQSERFLNTQEERGLFRSGESERGLQENILAPGLESRRQALLNLVMGGVGQEAGFKRQQQMGQQDFDRQLSLLDRKLANERELLSLQKDLGMFGQKSKPSFASTLTQGLASGLGAGIGNAILPGVGGAVGGMFGKAGGDLVNAQFQDAQTFNMTPEWAR